MVGTWLASIDRGLQGRSVGPVDEQELIIYVYN
jgi:hypothetical protein